MNEISKISALNYLSSRLEFSKTDTVNLSDYNSGHSINNKNENLELRIKNSDISYLLLRDSVDQYTKISTIVEISNDSLSKVGDYLVEIQSQVIKLSNTSDINLREQISSEINRLENEMSIYIGKNVASSGSRKINVGEISPETKEKYFEAVKNDEFTETDAKNLAALEVNFVHAVYEQTSGHNELSCSICQQKNKNKIENSNEYDGPHFAGVIGGNSVKNDPVAHFGPTTNTTADTGVSANATTSTPNLDSLMFPNKWKVSAGQTLSYSYYQTSGVTYNYSINGSTATSNLGNGPGTAGNSLIGNGASSDVEASLDMAFKDWEDVGSWTFEKITETSANGTTTVGEIRSRAMTDIGATEYGAFAYGPANSAKGGDIWYTVGSSKDFNPGNIKYYTALHEIGHAIGLNHPFSATFSRGSATLTDSLDTVRNSVMSYTLSDRNRYFNNVSTSSYTYTGIYPEDPGVLDVNVIEHMYGTSTTTNLGDTTYTFDDKPVMLRTIIDSGGNDTLDFSNQTEEVHINLFDRGTAATVGLWTEAEQLNHYSSIGVNSVTLASMSAAIVSVNAGQSAGGTHTSPLLRGWYTGEENLQIPRSTVIENVIGGSADDIIYTRGSVYSSYITGGPGNDTLYLQQTRTPQNGEDVVRAFDTAVFSGPIANYSITSSSASQTLGINNYVSAQITDNVGNDGSDSVFGAIRLQFKDAIWDNINNKIIGKPSWQNTEPDYTKSYKPVVRGNGSINTQAFPILAKLNISQLKSVATGEFTGDAKALFTEGLKTDAEITDALDALDELLKQISEQQSVIAFAQANITENITSKVESNNPESKVNGISMALLAEVEQAGFVTELMTEIRAQIQGIINSQITALAPSNDQEVISLLA